MKSAHRSLLAAVVVFPVFLVFWPVVAKADAEAYSTNGSAGTPRPTGRTIGRATPPAEPFEIGERTGETIHVTADWPTYHGSRGLTGISDVALPEPSAIRELWRFKAGSRVVVAPVVADGRVCFATADGRVIALNLDGKRVWRAGAAAPGATNGPAIGESFMAPPLVVGSMVVIGTSGGTLCAFDAATGRPRWRAKIGPSIQGSANWVDCAEPPGYAIIALSQADGVIHCVRPADGSLLWKSKPTNRTDGSPAAGAEAILYGNCDAALHVFSTRTGEPLRSIALGESSQIAGGVALEDDLVYAGTRSGEVIAANTLAGTVLWSNTNSEAEVFSTPAVSGGHVVWGSNDGRVYAAERKTGRGLWTFKAGSDAGSPVIAGGCVVATGSGRVYVIRLQDGAPVWSNAVSDEVTSPAVAAGRIYVGTDEGDLVAFGGVAGRDAGQQPAAPAGQVERPQP